VLEGDEGLSQVGENCRSRAEPLTKHCCAYKRAPDGSGEVDCVSVWDVGTA